MQRHSRKNRSHFITDFTTLPGYNGMHRESQSLNRKDKENFLVYKHDKYFVLPTNEIAFFYVKNETTLIACFDKRDYFLKYPLDQVEQLVSDQQFYRLNQHCLINFGAVKQVERYFARKLLIIPPVVFPDKLLVSKEKARSFLNWLENR
jgi:two-component system, LytTR family, response regulator LytT